VNSIGTRSNLCKRKGLNGRCANVHRGEKKVDQFRLAAACRRARQKRKKGARKSKTPARDLVYNTDLKLTVNIENEDLRRVCQRELDIAMIAIGHNPSWDYPHKRKQMELIREVMETVAKDPVPDLCIYEWE